MKYRYAILLFIGAFLIQSTVLIHLGIFGVTPNLILCLVVLLAFLYEGYEGMVLGIIFGLLQDLCFAEIIGVAAICYFLLTLFVFLIRELLYKDNVFSVLVLVAMGTALYYLCYWAILVTFGKPFDLVYMLRVVPISIIYNCFVCFVYHFVAGRRLIKNPNDRFI